MAGEYQRIALSSGISARLHEVIGDAQREEDVADVSELGMQCRAHLSSEEYDRIYRLGQAMPLDQLLAVVGDVAMAAPPSHVPALAARLGITRRELEVLELLGQNLTDQEIADRLYISRRTVNSHVSRLLTKLGAPSRRQAVSVARKHQLLET